MLFDHVVYKSVVRWLLGSRSHFDIFGEKLRLFDKTALFKHHLVDLELSHVVDRAHTVMYLLLSMSLERAVNGFVVISVHTVIFVQIGVVKLLIQNASKCHARVELYPGGRQHEVDVALDLVAPKLDHASQVELAHHVV